MNEILFRKVCLISLFFSSIDVSIACISTVSRNCNPNPETCTQEVYEQSRQITFVDVNFSHCEVAKIRCDAKRNCEKFVVIPKIDQKKPRHFLSQMILI